jgi:hypothetical protein
MRPHPFVLALALAGMPLAQAATSRFDTGTEGWTAAGDSAGPLTWLSTGGNPGGHAAIADSVVGGVTYFVAPAAFRGNQSGALGTSLRFDLKQVYPGAANQFDAVDVVLAGAGLTLVYDLAANPPNGSWASYAVPLSPGGWRLNTLGGAAASGAQLGAVLGSVTDLRIRAEYQTGADTGYLDNVSLVPEPASAALMLGGLAALVAARRRRGSVGPA